MNCEAIIDAIHHDASLLDGLWVPVLSLQELICQKRSLGRDEDLVALRMLEEVARQRGIDRGG